MIKKLATVLMFLILLSFVQAATSESKSATTIGGHFMFFDHDSSSGTRVYTNGSGTYIDRSSKNMGMYPAWLVLYINHVVNDLVTIEFSPQIQNVTGATPVFGTNVGDGKSTSKAPLTLAQGETPPARAIFKLPGQYELTVGNFYQRLSWCYGDIASWQDHMMIPRQLYRGGLNLHDSGFQVYKELDINGYRLPVTAVVGNGNSWNQDKDGTLAYLLKLEPEYNGFKFNLAGAFNPMTNTSGQNVNDYRGVVGVQFSNGPWFVRSEYFSTQANNGRTVSTSISTKVYDGQKKDGYNVIVKYQLLDNLSLETAYYFDKSNGRAVYDGAGYTETYKDLYFGATYSLADGAELIMTYESGDYYKKDARGPGASASFISEEVLVFNRLEIGTRITF